MQENGVPGEKPAEASLDWKLNGYTTLWPGVEPGLSGLAQGK